MKRPTRICVACCFTSNMGALDVGDYCAAYNLDPHAVDVQDVQAVQDAAARLNAEQWLLVEHVADPSRDGSHGGA